MKYKTFKEFEEAVERVAPFATSTVEWTTGGMTGGSCWDDGESNVHYAVESEPEPEDENLDNVLQEVMPDLTFLEFRKLMRAEIYERGDRSVNEYYGNYYTYSWKKLDLEKLYKALVDIAGCR